MRLKGNLLLLLKDAAKLSEAEQLFRSAIQIERRYAAKWYELLSTTALARLLRDTGRRDEARAMLAEIYNWFTEEFRHRRPEARQGAAGRVEQFHPKSLSARSCLICVN